MLASETETYAAEERDPSVDAGWMAELERLDAPMVFKSGAQAERAARTLANAASMEERFSGWAKSA